MKHLKSYKIFESNKDHYHDLMMVLNDLFDDWNIISYSTERFGDDVIGESDYPEHKFWTFRDISGDIMTSSIDSIKDVKDIVIYNIPTNDEDKFLNDLISYKEQIEELTGKTFRVEIEEVNNLYNDYMLRLI